MNKKVYLAFFASFLIFYFLLQTFFGLVLSRQEELDAQQTRIIQETVKERFKLMLKLPLSLGVIGADHFSTGDLTEKEYGQTFSQLMSLNPEILSLSVIDREGKILKVFPRANNPDTEGRTTQHLQALLASHEAGDELWFSPPFQLFQGKAGFALYFPILHKSGLRGWFTTVMSAELFLKMFRLNEYQESYDLVIKDDLTGKPYFSSTGSRYENARVYDYSSTIFNRQLSFQSWRKEGHGFYNFPWYTSFIIALALAFTSMGLIKLREQKKKALAQLHEISAVLRLTAKEAINKLADLHTEFNELKPTDLQKSLFAHNVTYVGNLIEQIELLQIMAESREEIAEENEDFSSVLEKLLEQFKDIIEKKHLNVRFDLEALRSIPINPKALPLQYSVVSHILSHSIIYAQEGSAIDIQSMRNGETNFITFHTKNIYQDGPDGNAIRIDRKMNVAQKILQIYNGKLFLQNDLANGMIIKMLLPSAQT